MTRTSPRHARPATVPAVTARGLGWFSLALGVAELLMPRRLGRVLGLGESAGTLLRVYGLREIAAGAGLLTSREPAPWMWGRVAGDVLDLATLAAHHDARHPRAGNTRAAMVAVAGVTALDLACARGLATQARRHQVSVTHLAERSGFPAPPSQMRGQARANGHAVEVPSDLQAPEALQPWRAAPESLH